MSLACDPIFAAEPHDAHGLAELLRKARADILATYLQRLEQIHSPILRTEIARGQCMQHAAAILWDVEAHLRGTFSFNGEDRSRLARRIGTARAAAGVHPSESLRAATELFTVTLTTLCGTAKAMVTPDATMAIGVALSTVIGRQLQHAASAYGTFMLERVRDAHAEERRRIARDIHDRVAQNLVAAARSIELYLESDPSRDDRRITTAQAALSQTIRSIRQVTADARLMRPVEGLEPALRAYLEAIAPPELEQSIELTGDDGTISPAVRDQVFLIACEAIRNAIAHAQPSTVRARIDIGPHELHLSVSDDGIGIDKAQFPTGNCSGLVSIRERAELLGGVFSVSSSPGSGTRVELFIPLQRWPAGEIRILIADDHALVREGVIEILSTVDDFTIVGEAGDATEATAMASRLRPDVLLLDVEMGDSDVTTTVAAVSESSPDTRILMLSMHDDPVLIRSLVAQGVRGYLVKNATRHELISAIRCSLISTQVVLAASLSLLSGTAPAEALPVPQVLTMRQIEILKLVADALSNAQVARRLRLTEATVKRHMRVIFAKLGAVSRIDAVNRATEIGLLPPPRKWSAAGR